MAALLIRAITCSNPSHKLHMHLRSRVCQNVSRLAEHERYEKRQGVLLRMAEAFGDDLDRHHRVNSYGCGLAFGALG